MRMIFKVSFYVRSNYENKSGKSPLMIRIYLNKEITSLKTKCDYSPKRNVIFSRLLTQNEL